MNVNETKHVSLEMIGKCFNTKSVNIRKKKKKYCRMFRLFLFKFHNEVLLVSTDYFNCFDSKEIKSFKKSLSTMRVKKMNFYW